VPINTSAIEVLRRPVEFALTASVAVEDDPGCGPTPNTGGHGERVEDELGAHVLGHRVAQQSPAAQVEDRRQVEPALTGRDVGNVANPSNIGPAGSEPAADQVRQRWRVLGRDGRADLGRLVHAHDPVRPHQPLDSLVVDRPAAVDQLDGHPRRAVSAVELLVDRPNPGLLTYAQ